MVPFENRMPFEIRTRLTIRNPDMSGFRIPTVICCCVLLFVLLESVERITLLYLIYS